MKLNALQATHAERGEAELVFQVAELPLHGGTAVSAAFVVLSFFGEGEEMGAALRLL